MHCFLGLCHNLKMHQAVLTCVEINTNTSQKRKTLSQMLTRQKASLLTDVCVRVCTDADTHTHTHTQHPKTHRHTHTHTLGSLAGPVV